MDGVSSHKRSPIRTMLGLLALSAVVHVGIAVNSPMTGRDSLGFAVQAKSLGNVSNVPEYLRESHHPPGYVACVAGCQWVVSRVYSAPLPGQLLASAQIVSVLAGILIAIPAWGICTRLLGQRTGCWATVVFLLLPAVARHTTDAITDGLFLCLFSWSIWLGMIANNRSRWFAAGFVSGLAYLVRPEALLIPVCQMIMASGDRKVVGSVFVKRIIPLLAGLMIPVLPYVCIIGGLTNKPAWQFEQSPLSPGGRGAGGEGVQIQIGLFASFWTSTEDSQRLPTACKEMAKEYLRMTHYAVGFLAILGIALGWRHIRPSFAWRTLLLISLSYLCIVFYFLALRKGYISDRHLLPLALPSCALASLAIHELGVRLHRCLTPALFIVLIACFIPTLIKPLHDNRAGHRHAGLFLATYLSKDDQLIDPFEWATYHSGRMMNPATSESPKTMIAVLDSQYGDASHPRLHRYAEAVQIARDPRSELIYHWPTDIPVEKAKVFVYRFPLGK